ncbi:MAG: pyruvate formate-lyase-activating protein [Bacillota bacterium]|nr:pyruvate formate-lyase-activating protein [Bacillota bacterium]
MKSANLHSVETMGLVDGPGIRTVFFLQGCPLKCSYCHNPDSQHFMGDKRITVDEVIETADRYREYYDASGGGVTFSGGEALMQGEFVAEAFKALKKSGISTCLDTSGYGVVRHYESVLKYTDHILLDIKHVDEAEHLKLTGRNMDGIKHFIDVLSGFEGKVTIRHVMIPDQTDHYEMMDRILEMIDPIQKKVDKIEILPYHKAGTEKYSQLNIPYKFEMVPAMDPVKAQVYEAYINARLETMKIMESEHLKAV